ncbi:MAG TPA: hypothetical protein VH916_07395 [Dehalococcoidia bacterium]
MAKIEIADGTLSIIMEGMDKLWALKSRLDIPLEHVVSVAHDPAQAKRWPRGLRLPGSFIPGVLTAGSYWKSGHGDGDGWSFWDVHNAEQAIVIETNHEHYKRVVVGVTDPAAVVRQIQGALHPGPSAPS